MLLSDKPSGERPTSVGMGLLDNGRLMAGACRYRAWSDEEFDKLTRPGPRPVMRDAWTGERGLNEATFAAGPAANALLGVR